MRERLLQVVFLAVAVAAMLVGGQLARPIQAERETLDLSVTSRNAGALEPKAALLQIAPGGLRAPFISYLWIRSQDLKDQGKLYDAKQLRDLICELMPHFGGVWSYHGWDMAWNISIMTRTPEERWMWVENGIKLLRDKGLLYNPDDIVIYRQLSWTYADKIGRYNDDFHAYYKFMVARQMDNLLGAPPSVASDEDPTAHFRPIAEAPDTVEKLRADPQVADFLARLEEVKLKPDDEFVYAYNRYSDDPLVGSFQPPRDKNAKLDEEQTKIRNLMRSPDYAAPRAKVLAFTRRTALLRDMKLDPEWMLYLMEYYGPMDWRSASAHAIYWATMGLKRTHVAIADTDALNTERNVLTPLKTLCATGQLYTAPRPDDPQQVSMDWGPDWRFIEAAHREYIKAGEHLAGNTNLRDPKNYLYDAHINFLSTAICQLFIGGREELAAHYFDELMRLYHPKEDIYKQDLYGFVREKINEHGTPTPEMTKAFTYGSLVRTYKALLQGNQADFARYREFSQRVYKIFAGDTGKTLRYTLAPYEDQEGYFLITLFIRPEAVGLRIPTLDKAHLYSLLSTAQQQKIYPYIAEAMQDECGQENLNFAAAFPAPPGAEAPATQPTAKTQ